MGAFNCGMVELPLPPPQHWLSPILFQAFLIDVWESTSPKTQNKLLSSCKAVTTDSEESTFRVGCKPVSLRLHELGYACRHQNIQQSPGDIELYGGGTHFIVSFLWSLNCIKLIHKLWAPEKSESQISRNLVLILVSVPCLLQTRVSGNGPTCMLPSAGWVIHSVKFVQSTTEMIILWQLD